MSWIRQTWNRLPGAQKRLPEDSVELRAWVLAGVLVGEAAVLSSGYFDAVTGVLVPFSDGRRFRGQLLEEAGEKRPHQGVARVRGPGGAGDVLQGGFVLAL